MFIYGGKKGLWLNLILRGRIKPHHQASIYPESKTMKNLQFSMQTHKDVLESVTNVSVWWDVLRIVANIAVWWAICCLLYNKFVGPSVNSNKRFSTFSIKIIKSVLQAIRSFWLFFVLWWSGKSGVWCWVVLVVGLSVYFIITGLCRIITQLIFVGSDGYRKKRRKVRARKDCW